MRRAWIKRRASAAMVAEWFAHPICLCGCGGPLARIKNPRRQHFFLQGHDARLKSLLRKVLNGEVPREQIPAAARANLAKLKFVQASAEFKRAFANPGQRQRRTTARETSL